MSAEGPKFSDMRNYIPYYLLCMAFLLSNCFSDCIAKNISQGRKHILKPMPNNLPACVEPEDITYTVIPPNSGLNYKVNVYDIFEPVEGHYHAHQTQEVMVLDGQLKVQLNDETPIILGPSGKIQILPNVWHVLEPVNGPVRYISTYFFDAAQHPTGLPFPEDVNLRRIHN